MPGGGWSVSGPVAVDNVTLQKSAQGVLSIVPNRLARVQRGTYTGDGAASQAVAVGFRPQCVFIANASAVARNALFVDSPDDNEVGDFFTPATGTSTSVDMTATGFTVGAVNLNIAAQVYRWIAFGGAT